MEPVYGAEAGSRGGMTRIYTYDDSEDVRRKVQAMLPAGFKVRAGVYNDGLTLGLVVVNAAQVSRLYEFGWAGKTETDPGRPAASITDLALLQIVSQWRTGTLVEEAPGEPLATAPSPAAQTVETREQFLAWLRDAKVGAQALYHRGSLAHYRKDAPLRLIHLERLQDEAKPASPRPRSEAVEIEQIRMHLELLTTVTQMAEADLVHLVQRRAMEEGQSVYYAVKKER